MIVQLIEHVFYGMGIFFLLFNITNIFTIEKYYEVVEKYMLAEDSEQELSPYSRQIIQIEFVYGWWLMLGLITDQWWLFLAALLYTRIVGAVLSTPGLIFLLSVNILVISFSIINNYYLHYFISKLIPSLL